MYDYIDTARCSTCTSPNIDDSICDGAHQKGDEKQAAKDKRIRISGSISLQYLSVLINFNEYEINLLIFLMGHFHQALIPQLKKNKNKKIKCHKMKLRNAQTE